MKFAACGGNVYKLDSFLTLKCHGTGGHNNDDDAHTDDIDHDDDKHKNNKHKDNIIDDKSKRPCGRGQKAQRKPAPFRQAFL